MCGIAGTSGASFDKDLVSQMLSIMKHRGPDSNGYYLSDGIHIGHCRLSINDLSERARQPFISSDKSVAVAVNGEIYNYNVLKQELIGRGCSFTSHSDCEVVLHAYLEHGLEFIPELNGMFAISLWDGRRKKLYLIRDRLGIKQLYYARTRDSVLFASEIKALACYEGLDLSLDVQSFAEYLTFGNYFSNRTLNANIQQLEPGEIVTFDLRNNTADRKYYWQPVFSAANDDRGGDLSGKYLHVIEASVNRHLLSDVPLGSYLSAGIDSSSVVYWAARKTAGKIKTYTGHFSMPGFYDEAADAERISKQYGCEHTSVEITPQDFVQNMGKILWHLDEPRVGMGAFSQYMVAKRASRDVTVILTGHGGDELFAGYPVFKAIFGKSNVPRLVLNSSLRELMFAAYFALYPKIRREVGYYLPNLFALQSFGRVLQPAFHSEMMKHADPFRELDALKASSRTEYERLTMTYLKYFLPALFNVEDKISMAFSLESRTPLCDNAMLDLALSIPLSRKLINYELKHIPRTAMRGKLPEFVYALPKRGFPTPLKYWFRNELRKHVRDMIMDNLGTIDMFNKTEVIRILTAGQRTGPHTPLDEINAYKLWVILNLIFYFKQQKNRYCGYSA